MSGMFFETQCSCSFKTVVLVFLEPPVQCIIVVLVFQQIVTSRKAKPRHLSSRLIHISLENGLTRLR